MLLAGDKRATELSNSIVGISSLLYGFFLQIGIGGLLMRSAEALCW